MFFLLALFVFLSFLLSDFLLQLVSPEGLEGRVAVRVRAGAVDVQGHLLLRVELHEVPALEGEVAGVAALLAAEFGRRSLAWATGGFRGSEHFV